MYISCCIIHAHNTQDDGWISVDELIPKRVFFIGCLLEEESKLLKYQIVTAIDDNNLFPSPYPVNSLSPVPYQKFILLRHVLYCLIFFNTQRNYHLKVP